MAAPSWSLDAATAPAGYKGLRGAMLVELKKAPELTARDLAERLGVSLNAVRHHLKELSAESLVEYERRPHGVGAPVFAYRLTAAGEGLFPNRYAETLTRLLDRLERQEGRQAAVALLEAHFAELTERLAPGMARAEPRRRLELLAAHRASEGYMAEAELAQGEARLTQHHCAIRAVAERFPEICDAETRFLRAVLGAPVERREHILEGCSACAYVARLGSADNRDEPEAEGASEAEETA